MTAPKTLSAEDSEKITKALNAALNLKVMVEVERRAHEWLVAAKGVDWAEKFEEMAKKAARTEDLEKEVEKIKQDMHLAVSNAGKDLIKERDAAIERAEKAEKEALLVKRLLSRVRPNHASGCFGRTLKGEPTTAEFCEEVKCKVWQRRQLLSEGVSIDAEDPEVVALKKEVSGVQKRVSKLQQERDQALALANGYRESLTNIKDRDGAFPYALEVKRIAKEGLTASPTSLLERFKAEQSALSIFAELVDNCEASLAEGGISDERRAYRKILYTRALEVLEKLK